MYLCLKVNNGSRWKGAIGHSHSKGENIVVLV